MIIGKCWFLHKLCIQTWQYSYVYLCDMSEDYAWFLIGKETTRTHGSSQGKMILMKNLLHELDIVLCVFGYCLGHFQKNGSYETVLKWRGESGWACRLLLIILNFQTSFDSSSKVRGNFYLTCPTLWYCQRIWQALSQTDKEEHSCQCIASINIKTSFVLVNST